MRKVIVYVNVTIDGHLCGPDGDMSWMDIDPAMNSAFADAMRDRVDTMLLGRNAYQGFEQHFRASAADPASEPGLVDFSKWMVDTPKVVVTNTLTEVSDVATTAGDVVAAVAELKARPGKDIVAFAGVHLVNSLVDHGLADEFWLKIAPTAIGAGRPLFTTHTALRLMDSTAWPSGTITARYAVV